MIDCDCIPREQMPQVDEVDLPALIEFLKGRGIIVAVETVCPRLVRGRQKIDRTKVRQMPDWLLAKPILISQDSLVIDGNHRWFGLVMRDKPMIAIRLSLKFSVALPIICEFPKAYRLDGLQPIRN